MMVTILYGSETGTAEEVAFRLYSALARVAGVDTQIWSMDDYDLARLPTEHTVIFVVSTTGDGEVPGSMKRFWAFLLRKSLPATSLQNVSVAVFGLGDSSYEKFNATARKLTRRLQQLGAREMLPVGLGDDQDKYGYFTELDGWSATLLSAIGGSITTTLAAAAGDAPVRTMYTVQMLSSENGPSPDDVNVMVGRLLPPPTDAKHHRCGMRMSSSSNLQPLLPIAATVKENRRMTSATWDQDVRHVVLSLQACTTTTATITSEESSSSSSSEGMHVAGDVATVCPENDPALVQRMLDVVADTAATTPETQAPLRGDSVVKITRAPEAVKRKSRLGDVPRCRVDVLLSRLLGIAGMPQRAFFEGLAAHATNEDEKEKLFEIASPAGTDLYYDYCIKEKRNYVEVMEDFKSARPPLACLLELLPLMQPRHYSIANSGRVRPAELDLCVAVAMSKTPYGRRKVGLCSGFLARQAPGDIVLLWVRRGAFALDKHVGMAGRAVDASTPPPPPPPLPLNPRTNLLLVGPGTGVAPMRAILQERLAAVAPPAAALFFGCRGRHADFLYGDEWQGCSNGAPTVADADADADAVHGDGVSVVTAFSRDQPQKVYVTDKLRRYGARVWAMLDPMQARGVVFVSGSAKSMPADVRAALRDVVVTHGARSEAEAAAFLQQMEKEGRYIVEAWS